MDNANIHTKFTPRQIKTIEILAAGTDKTNEQICSEVGVSTKTFYNWKKRRDFLEAIVARARELLRSQLPDLYSIAAKKAKKGSHQHLKIILDHLDKLENSLANLDDTIVFAWKSQ